MKIRLKGGSASVKDRLKVASDAWGDLWKCDVVEIAELPEGRLDPITWKRLRLW